LYVTVFNVVDLTGFEIGDKILIMTDKNDFGFTKTRGHKIQKLN